MEPSLSYCLFQGPSATTFQDAASWSWVQLGNTWLYVHDRYYTTWLLGFEYPLRDHVYIYKILVASKALREVAGPSGRGTCRKLLVHWGMLSKGTIAPSSLSLALWPWPEQFSLPHISDIAIRRAHQRLRALSLSDLRLGSPEPWAQINAVFYKLIIACMLLSQWNADTPACL